MSHVVLGYNEPSIKACTMDGNIALDDKSQMRVAGQICGFWSDSQSDNDGVFSEPYPYVDVSFIARSIIDRLVIGDAKLNQYPVDFDIICFNAKNMEISRQNYIQNNSTLINIKFVVMPIDVTKIRIEIYKWNKPNCKQKHYHFIQCLKKNI